MWSKSDSLFKAKAILDLLHKNNIEPKTICEPGCGNGEILKILSEVYVHSDFLGIDISKDAITLAEGFRSERIRFQVADVIDPNFQLESEFELCLSIDIIEHLENYFEYLRKIKPACTHAVFHIPLDMSIWRLFREKMLLESKDKVGHIHNFTQDFVLSVVSDMGFELIDVVYTLPHYQPKGFKAHVVYKLRKLLFKLSKHFCAKSIGGLSILVLTKAKED